MELTSTQRAITVKDATHIAIDTAKQIFEGQALLDLALEEVEISDDDKFWMITLGFSVEQQAPVPDNLFGAFSQNTRYERKYKLFQIDAESGEVYSMKIRALA